MEGQFDITKAIEDFYSSIYVPANPGPTNCLAMVPNIVFEEVNQKLMSPVLIDEIERAVFPLEALKSPGPDGLNGEFYQKNWDIVKMDVCDAVSEFFLMVFSGIPSMTLS